MDRERILTQLVEMTLYLGSPEKDYVIMGEGNTSARSGENTFWVKASGSSMVSIRIDDFVEIQIDRILKVLDNKDARDEDITEAYDHARVNPSVSVRPSIETILHALALQNCQANFIGHTHPLFVNMILCSKKADEALAGRLFTEEVTFCGLAPAIMSYRDPGLPLARGFQNTILDYQNSYGESPRLVLIKNHGMIAIGKSAQEVKNITDMYDKVARVLLGTYFLGGPNFLTREQIDRINTRPDEIIRLQKLGSL